MALYEVSLCYNLACGKTVDIEAASPEEACRLAVERADADPEGFRAVDYVSPTYVVEFAELAESDAPVRELAVPSQFTECRRVHGH